MRAGRYCSSGRAIKNSANAKVCGERRRECKRRHTPMRTVTSCCDSGSNLVTVRGMATACVVTAAEDDDVDDDDDDASVGAAAASTSSSPSLRASSYEDGANLESAGLRRFARRKPPRTHIRHEKAEAVSAIRIRIAIVQSHLGIQTYVPELFGYVPSIVRKGDFAKRVGHRTNETPIVLQVEVKMVDCRRA